MVDFGWFWQEMNGFERQWTLILRQLFGFRVFSECQECHAHGTAWEEHERRKTRGSQTLLIAACFKTGTAVLRTIYKLWTWINRCWRIHVKPSKLCIMGLALQRPIYLCSFHPIFVGAFSSFLLKARKIAISNCLLLCHKGFALQQ